MIGRTGTTGRPEDELALERWRRSTSLPGARGCRRSAWSTSARTPRTRSLARVARTLLRWWSGQPGRRFEASEGQFGPIGPADVEHPAGVASNEERSIRFEQEDIAVERRSGRMVEQIESPIGERVITWPGRARTTISGMAQATGGTPT